MYIYIHISHLLPLYTGHFFLIKSTAGTHFFRKTYIALDGGLYHCEYIPSAAGKWPQLREYI